MQIKISEPATNYVTETMQDNAVLAEGNLTRLAAVMKGKSRRTYNGWRNRRFNNAGSSATNEKNSYAYLFINGG